MVCWSLLLSSNMHFVRGHKFHFPDFKFCQVWHFFWVVPTQNYIGVLLYVVHNSGFFLSHRKVISDWYLLVDNEKLVKLLGQFSDLAVPPTCNFTALCSTHSQWQLVVCTVQYRTGNNKLLHSSMTIMEITISCV